MEDNINRREKKKKAHRFLSLATTPSREVAQRLSSTSSEEGLNREAWAACIGWRPGLNTLRTI